jgi:hypothetical protein
VRLVGQFQERFAGDRDVFGGLGESVQQRGQLHDLLVSGLRFHGDLPLADLQAGQQGAEG